MTTSISKARVAESAGPLLDLLLQGCDLGVAWDRGLEVLELLALLGLDLQGDLAAAIQELTDPLEVLLPAASGSHSRGSHADAAGGEGGRVSVHRVAVQCDGGCLANLLHLGAGEAVGAQVPKQQMVVRAVAGELVALGHQGLCQGLGVGLDLLGVVLEHGGVHLQQLRGQGSNLVIVRATLQGWEDGHVDTLLDVRDLLRVLEEDHASAGSSQRLVGRGGHDVAVLKRRRVLSRSNQARDVGDVCHENCSNLIRNFPELAEVDDARIRRGSAKDHGRSED